MWGVLLLSPLVVVIVHRRAGVCGFPLSVLLAAAGLDALLMITTAFLSTTEFTTVGAQVIIIAPIFEQRLQLHDRLLIRFFGLVFSAAYEFERKVDDAGWILVAVIALNLVQWAIVNYTPARELHPPSTAKS